MRKEVRNLSAREYKMFMQGLAVMWSTSTEAGRRIYGPKFREMDYFVIKHAVMSMVPYGNPMAGNSVSWSLEFVGMAWPRRWHGMEALNSRLQPP